ncbi:hypothetical protein GGR90_001669 [Sphingopyxis italica]|uniref:Uncharacterized protein n=1 Tax=Sphingopyxis italica TaxID=1129133 RepID=A0A7X6B8P0_9SPHN|nr:hypothetical protein [Sphingopyxis italica]NJB89494.1 hypothetical protein [Sphingopyxis italica]
MHTHEEFGALIGKSLVEAETSADVPRVAAAQFVGALMAEHPSVKLPALLANVDVRQWMNDARVSESMLRTALTDARKTSRESARPKDVVRVPPRLRKKVKGDGDTKASAKANAPQSGAQDTYVVQNLPLDLL